MADGLGRFWDRLAMAVGAVSHICHGETCRGDGSHGKRCHGKTTTVAMIMNAVQ
jgi:hypothetical protein